MSREESESLSREESESVDAFADQFQELLASMQGPRAEAAWDVAFNASPEELGRAAVEAALGGTAKRPPRGPQPKDPEKR